MFGSKREEKTSNQTVANTSAPSTSTSINSLVNGTKVEGKINTKNDIRIDGQLVGSLDCKGRVIIGPEGVINGDITCVNAIIEGSFKGNIKVTETLHVKESAKIEGDVDTNKLLVQPGAVLNVSCNMGGKKLKSFANKVEKGKEPELTFTKAN